MPARILNTAQKQKKMKICHFKNAEIPVARSPFNYSCTINHRPGVAVIA